MPILFRDIETRSTLDLPEVGTARYAGDPRTDVWCVCFAIDDRPVQTWIPGQPIPEEFHTAARESDWLIVAHNDAFERAIEERILAPRYGWPIVPIERHRCTMAMASASALPAELSKVAEVLKLPTRKDDDGARLMKQMARPRKPRVGSRVCVNAHDRCDGGASAPCPYCEPKETGIHWHDDDPEKLERLYTYCRNDVEVERELYHRLPPLADSEQALWVLDATINSRGFHTDGPLLKASSQIAAAAGQAAHDELTRITDGALTGTDQVAALQAWLGEHGCGVKDIRKPTLRHALRRKELDPVVRRVIELRLGAAHAAAAKIDTLLAWRDADGRVRGTLQFHGAGTGRWTGHGPQPQNFKRDGEDIETKRSAIATGDLAHVQECYPQPLEAVGDIARAMIVPAPGHRFLIGDFSGIESRVLAWVAGQQSKLDQWAKFDRTGDSADEPYYILGRSCGQPEESARKTGKTADLAFGYMGGPGAWDRLAPEDDNSSEADKKRYQRTWRSLHPQTVRFWSGIDRAAITAVRKQSFFTYKQFTLAFDGTFLRIVLPSGRALSYPFPRLEKGRYGDPKVVFKDNAAGKFVDCRFGQGAYGGLWTENIVQAVSRDLLAAAMMRLEAAGYAVTLHVHDEIVAEAPIGFGGVDEFQRLITALPDWADGLPIAAKVRNGERFSKSTSTENIEESCGPTSSPQSDTTSIPDQDDEKANGMDNAAVENPGDSDAAADERNALDELLAAAYHAQSPDPAASESGDEENIGDEEGPADSGGDSSSDAGANSSGAAGSTFSGDPELGPYIYRDASGKPHAKVVRTPGRQSRFTQQHWTGTAWATGMPKHKLPYRLAELLAADPAAWVCITEGEKDAVNVAKLGLVATTNPNGSKGWNSAKLVPYFAHLRRVAVLEDNDDAGRERTERIIKTLRILDPVPDIRVVSFPELPEGGDVSDWLAQDRSRGRAELLARIEAVPAGAKLSFINMSRWDFDPVPEQEWAVLDRIPLGQTALFTGEGGYGKSTIQLHLCAAHSLSRGWLDTVPEPGPAIFFEAEDGEKTIHRRLAAIATHYEVTFEEMIRGGLHLISLFGHDCVLATPERNGKIEPTSVYNQLLQAAGDIKPKMLSIASSANVFAGSELDRSQTQQFIGLLNRLALIANGAVVLIAHPSLTGISSDTGLSGSTQWHNAVRARFYLKSIKAEAGEQPDNDLRELVFKKNQFGPMSASIVLRYQAGLFLPEAGMSSLDGAAKEQTAEEVFTDLLKRFAAANRNVSDRSGANYAPAIFAREEEAKLASLTSKNLEGAMSRLFKAGKIWNEPCGRRDRNSFRIVIK